LRSSARCAAQIAAPRLPERRPEATPAAQWIASAHRAHQREPRGSDTPTEQRNQQHQHRGDPPRSTAITRKSAYGVTSTPPTHTRTTSAPRASSAGLGRQCAAGATPNVATSSGADPDHHQVNRSGGTEQRPSVSSIKWHRQCSAVDSRAKWRRSVRECEPEPISSAPMIARRSAYHRSAAVDPRRDSTS
jgi:hypothetical protein